MTTNLVGNGVIGAGEYVTRSNQVVIIPFTLTKGSATTNGQIVAMLPGHPRSLFTVDVNLVPGQFNGGTMRVAGHVFAVHKNQINVVEVKAADVKLDFTGLHDDDDDTLLPRVPDASLLTNALAEAYVVPMFDLPNPNKVVPLVSNVRFGTDDSTYFGPYGLVGVQRWDTKGLNQPDFWVAYILTCFQGDVMEDADPLGEVAETIVGGVTAVPDGGSLVFEEHLRELVPSSPAVRFYQHRVTVVHELGHGLTGAATEPVTRCDSALPPCQPTFEPVYLDFIRSSLRPLSQP